MYTVKLETFEGPLDLLLYLIRKNEIDIYNIPIAKITDQYMEYMDLMKSLDIEIAGEFILMAATLLYLKSETLLPSISTDDYEEPMMTREELVRQLLEYKKFKEAAMVLAKKEDARSELYPRSFIDPIVEDFEIREYKFTVSLFDLISAFYRIIKSLPEEQATELVEETITVDKKIEEIMRILENRKRVEFSSLFSSHSTKLEIIVTFLAILELTRLKRIVPRQSHIFGSIWLYKV